MTRAKNLIALCLLVLTPFATGCIVEEEPPPIGPPPTESPDEETPEDVDPLPQDDDLEGYECDDREARGCKIYLESHDGTQNCFVGVQYCVDGYWGACQEDPTGVYAAEAVDY
ncbi:MAG TPA: hypothetical protein ENK57_14460 [Polyangiaceae bacterium]|nr:hypothetical protein [Polyangiaceae bacterium]